MLGYMLGIYSADLGAEVGVHARGRRHVRRHDLLQVERLPVDLGKPRVAVDGEESLGSAAEALRLVHLEQPHLVRVRARARVRVRVRVRVS